MKNLDNPISTENLDILSNVRLVGSNGGASTNLDGYIIPEIVVSSPYQYESSRIGS